MSDKSSMFFIDLGPDKDPAYIKLFIKLFDLKEAKLKIHTPEGDIINTGLIVDYYEPARHDVETLVTPQNAPMIPECRKEDQLFIFDQATGGKFQNTMAIRNIFDEATLNEAYEIVGPNIFKITICESRYLGLEGLNKWTVFVPNRVIDRLAIIQRGLMDLMK